MAIRFGVLLLCAWSAPGGAAQEPPGGKARTAELGRSVAAANYEELHRAGCPQCLSRWAVTSNSRQYAGYYVGGTTPFARRGDGPRAHEGTWGWDYRGGFFQRHVALDWLHGRNERRRFGKYETDGPHFAERLQEKLRGE
jgi:hypothetical protein